MHVQVLCNVYLRPQRKLLKLNSGIALQGAYYELHIFFPINSVSQEIFAMAALTFPQSQFG